MLLSNSQVCLDRRSILWEGVQTYDSMYGWGEWCHAESRIKYAHVWYVLKLAVLSLT